jgi:hypothetical protein
MWLPNFANYGDKPGSHLKNAACTSRVAGKRKSRGWFNQPVPVEPFQELDFMFRRQTQIIHDSRFQTY